MNVRNVLKGHRAYRLKKDNWLSLSSVMIIIVLVTSLVSLLFFHARITPQFLQALFPCSCFKLKLYEDTPVSSFPKAHEVPAYFINLNRDFDKRHIMRNQLKQMGFQDINRVEAWTSVDVRERVKRDVTSIQNMIKNNDNEIACIASHLWAMYLAVSDPLNTSPYAMILEDDTKFQFSIDWEEMLSGAPEDFTILQLGTSNAEQQQFLWSHFKTLNQNVPVELQQSVSTYYYEQMTQQLARNQWFQRDWDSGFWSTQGYVINKEKVRKLIGQFVSFNDNKNRFEITLAALPQFPCKVKPCILPFRLVADIYLYAAFKPAFISRIPLLNGETHEHELEGNTDEASLSQLSAIQDVSKVKVHLNAFKDIARVVEEAASFVHILPAYFLRSLYHPTRLHTAALRGTIPRPSLNEKRRLGAIAEPSRSQLRMIPSDIDWQQQEYTTFDDRQPTLT